MEARLSGGMVWLSLNQMADLFQRDKSVISKHIKNVFAEGELKPDSVVANFATTAADGKNYEKALAKAGAEFEAHDQHGPRRQVLHFDRTIIILTVTRVRFPSPAPINTGIFLLSPCFSASLVPNF